MRILFTCRSLAGHHEPLVPLADAARSAGHDVAFASGSPVVERAEAAGFLAFRVGPDEGFRQTWLARFPGFDRLVGDDQRRFFFTEIFAGLELVPRAADLEQSLRAWRPDVVVHDVAELAAPLVCATSGVPSVDLSYGPLVPLAILRAAGLAAAPHWRARGLEPPAYAGLFRTLYLDTCPPSLQSDEMAAPDAPSQIQALRPGTATDIAAPAAPRPDRRPTVYVTMGTIWNRDLAVFQCVIDGLATADVDVVVTVGRDNDPAALGPQRAGVTVERFVPQAELLPQCDLVIAHGGAGTVLGALAHGLPLLVVPQGADQWANAASVVRAGAALSLQRAECTSAEVGRAAERLLREASFREAAVRIRAEIEAMPTPSEVVPVLESVT
jgi:UDP:flavonoid glycosyltransferase YjiC (YdhE family)